MKLRRTLLAASLLLGLPAFAHAQLTLTFDQPNQTGQAGSTFTFTGTLKNTSTNLVFVNGDSFTLNGTGLTLDDSPFFNDGPVSLNAGQTFTGTFFTVLAGLSAPAQSVSGSFVIIGGATDTTQNTVANAPFTVTISAPEPASGLLVLATTLTMGAIVRRQIRK